VRWRWQAVGGVAASASHRRVDGKNGSKGLGEGRRHGEGEGRGCVRACSRCFFFRGVLRGFEAKTTSTGDTASAARDGASGRNLEDGRMGGRGTRNFRIWDRLRLPH